MNAIHLMLSTLAVNQLAHVIRESGYEGTDDELAGVELKFLRKRESNDCVRFDYRTKFYDTNEECWCYGGVCVEYVPSTGNITAEYTGNAVPIKVFQG